MKSSCVFLYKFFEIKESFDLIYSVFNGIKCKKLNYSKYILLIGGLFLTASCRGEISDDFFGTYALTTEGCHHILILNKDRTYTHKYTERSIGKEYTRSGSYSFSHKAADHRIVLSGFSFHPLSAGCGVPYNSDEKFTSSAPILSVSIFGKRSIVFDYDSGVIFDMK
ncbi:hypothetical protein [Halovulum sp. GXIMD14793]